MAELNSPFARRMMAQKLMMDNKTNPFEQSEFFQPSDALEAPRVTGMLLPFSARRFGDEKDLRLAVPELVSDFFDATVGNTGKALRGELGVPSVNNPAFTGAVADMGMNVTGGSLLGSALTKSVPKNALSMGLKATKAADDVKPGDIAKVVPPTDKSDGIFAFHGSGADFDEFKLSKIGTGEGNQAFGYGLYFTESKDIAKFYKNAMSQKGTEGLNKTVDYKGKKINIDNIETNEESFVYANANLNPEITKNKLLKEKKRIEKEIKANNQAISQIQSGKVYKSFDGTEISEIQFEKNNKFFQPKLDAINKVIDNLSEIKIVDSAKTYEVKINAVMDDLIDYDKPLGQQSDNIKNILNKMKSEVTVDDAINLGFDPFDFAGSQKKAIQETIKSLFGKDEDVVRFLNNWAAIRGEKATGEKLLAKYGAKGIKYKADQGVGARNVPETGKNNFVIFDDKIIDIMAKYGIVGAIGVSAMKGINGGSESNTLPSDA
tara:strand:+ start:263 stop:1735 length:1473 start_codon:yes stop_codon:yes gene_type:complete